MKKKIRNSLSYRNFNKSKFRPHLTLWDKMRDCDRHDFRYEPSTFAKRCCPKGDSARAQSFPERAGRVPIWILIVVLMVILGLSLGVYRIFFVPRPLKMRKLESMYIIYPRSNHEWGWGIALVDVESDTALGMIYDNGNTYQKGNSYARLRDIFLRISMDEDEEINIPAGDRLEITYNGGKRLFIHLPRVTTTPEESVTLYLATDGSTYYDKGLTKLAQKAF